VCPADTMTPASTSARMMAGAVRNTIGMLGVPLPDALRMASTWPAQFLKVDAQMGRIAPGLRADLVLLDAGLEVLNSWIDGRDASA
jgi:N-acetylglucosamine-6-phosphate deacetylase